MDESTKVMSSLITGADLSYKTSWQLNGERNAQAKLLDFRVCQSPSFSCGGGGGFDDTRWMASTSRRESRADTQEEVALCFRAGLQQEEE